MTGPSSSGRRTAPPKPRYDEAATKKPRESASTRMRAPLASSTPVVSSIPSPLFDLASTGSHDNLRINLKSKAGRGIRRSQGSQHAASSLSSSKSNSPSFQWHGDIMYALRSGKWEHVRGQISLYNSLRQPAEQPPHPNQQKNRQLESYKRPSSSRFIWKRRQSSQRVQHEEPLDSLLAVDARGRTPLLLLLEAPHAPPDVVVLLVRACPAAARVPLAASRDENCKERKDAAPVLPSPDGHQQQPLSPRSLRKRLQLQSKDKSASRKQEHPPSESIRSRLPLHLAVINRHSLEAIACLVDAFPGALVVQDDESKIPLQHAVEAACACCAGDAPASGSILNYRHHGSGKGHHQHRRQQQGAKLSWMVPLPLDSSLQAWQQGQNEAWGVVHWLLLASATHQPYFADSKQNANGNDESDDNDGDGAAALSGSNTTHHASNTSSTLSSNNPTTGPRSALNLGSLLVDALLSAAPPGVIMLLLGAASVSSSSVPTSFSASPYLSVPMRDRHKALFTPATLYACLARHYPLSILKGLVSCCSAKTLKEIRKVRDETNMGLVSAAFVSGCFSQNDKTTEWNVVPRIWGALKASLERGEVVNTTSFGGTSGPPTPDPGFVEWWETIEYLLQLCDDDDNDDDHDDDKASMLPTSPGLATISRNTSRRQGKDTSPVHMLVHSALRNSDTPPWVFRMLTIMYPRQLLVQDPRTGARPIHMAAKLADYIPRNYEFQIVDRGRSTSPTAATTATPSTAVPSVDDVLPTGAASPSHVLVSLDRSVIFQRHHGRLPLHYAIDVGKTMSSLQPLVDHNTIACRDPVTMLYPYQQAASYSIGSSQDGWRWSCVARNKYSHAVWVGLTDRQKAEAIWRVAQAEDVERLGTVFTLLKCKPSLICAGCKSSRSTASRREAGPSRDVSKMRMISTHYLNLVYPENDTGQREQQPECFALFENAVAEALGSGGRLSRAPKDFRKWLHKLKFWIRYCETPNPPPGVPSISIGRSDDYLLHAALCNSDTPPKVTELLLSLNSSSARRCLPDSKLLPLHLAAMTPPYIYRDFEVQTRGALELMVRAFPAAAGCPSEMGYPLHMAIKSNRSWNELHLLVEADPTVLLRRDQGTGLYPFQLAALSRGTTAEYYSRCQSLTRSRIGESRWESLTPRHQVSEIRNEYRGQRLGVMTCIFELLRRDASVIGGPTSLWIEPRIVDSRIALEQDAKREVSDGGPMETFAVRENQVPLSSTELCDPEEDNTMLEPPLEDSTDGELDSEVDESEHASSYLEEPDMKKKATNQRPTLLAYFERTSSERSACTPRLRGDASVISGVDVMSLVSGPASLNPRARPGKSVASEEKSLNLVDLLLDQESSDESSSDGTSDQDETSAEFAEESSNADCELSSIVAHSLAGNDSGETESSETEVFFLMRREPNIRRKLAEERETTKQVMLSKKQDERSAPLRSKSMPLDQSLPKDSLRAMFFNSRHKRQQKALLSLHTVSSQSTSTGNDSFNSSLPEELGKVGSSATMLWVSQSLQDKKLLTSHASHSQMSSSRASDEESFFAQENASYTEVRRGASGSGKMMASYSSNISDESKTSRSTDRQSIHNSVSAGSRSSSRRSRASDGSTSALSQNFASSPSSNNGMTKSSRRLHSVSSNSSSSDSRTSGNSNRIRRAHSDVSDASTEIDILEISPNATGTRATSFGAFMTDAFDDSAHVFGYTGALKHGSQLDDKKQEASSFAGKNGTSLPLTDGKGQEDGPLEDPESRALALQTLATDSSSGGMTFDKATMRWIKREDAPLSHSVKKAAELRSVSTPSDGSGAVDVVFDKKLMRWIPRSQVRSGSSGASKGATPDAGRVGTHGKANSSPVTIRTSALMDTKPMALGLPFVEVVPSKPKHRTRRIEI